MRSIKIITSRWYRNRDRNGANFLLSASTRPEKTSHRPDSPRAESLFCSPPHLDPKKTFTRPASPRSEFHLCSPAPPRPDLSFTFAPRPAPPRLQKIHLFFENIIYLIIQYKASVKKIGTHAGKCVQEI